MENKINTLEIPGFLTVRELNKETHYHVAAENGDSILVRIRGDAALDTEMFAPGARVKITVEIEHDSHKEVRRHAD